MKDEEAFVFGEPPGDEGAAGEPSGVGPRHDHQLQPAGLGLLPRSHHHRPVPQEGEAPSQVQGTTPHCHYIIADIF